MKRFVLSIFLLVPVAGLSACGKRAPLAIPPDPDAPLVRPVPEAPRAEDLMEGIEAPVAPDAEEGASDQGDGGEEASGPPEEPSE